FVFYYLETGWNSIKIRKTLPIEFCISLPSVNSVSSFLGTLYSPNVQVPRKNGSIFLVLFPLVSTYKMVHTISLVQPTVRPDSRIWSD
ncbi:hypothetical protein GCK32_017547, partial [Trichostrongylus colubriformis]